MDTSTQTWLEGRVCRDGGTSHVCGKHLVFPTCTRTSRKHCSAPGDESQADAAAVLVEGDDADGDPVAQGDLLAVHLTRVDEAVTADAYVHKGAKVCAVLDLARELEALVHFIQGEDAALEQRLVLLCSRGEGKGKKGRSVIWGDKKVEGLPTTMETRSKAE